MKNILKIITLIAVTLLVTVSCDFEDSNYDMLTKETDPTATYYVQFTDAAQTAQTSVSLSGALVDIETTVAITLMGVPQSQDISVNLTLAPSSTMTANMFVLSANSITIPAGQTSGSVNFKTVAANMPVGETVKFALTLDAGEHSSPNENGTSLLYTLKRIEFCPLENGSADLAGSWSVTSDLNTGSVANPAWFTEDSLSAVANGAKLDVSGLSVSFLNNFWGENVVAGGTFTMDIAGNGFVTIPRQYIYSSDWGDDYEIEGSGTWTNCGGKPTLTFTYDIYYAGDSAGLAATYKAYLNGPYLGGTFTLN
jgi:hypothetical protein